MTANAFSMPFYLQEECRYTLRDMKDSVIFRTNFGNRVPKPHFPHMSIIGEEYGFGLIRASKKQMSRKRASISPGFCMVILKGGCSFEYHSDH